MASQARAPIYLGGVATLSLATGTDSETSRGIFKRPAGSLYPRKRNREETEGSRCGFTAEIEAIRSRGFLHAGKSSNRWQARTLSRELVATAAL